MKVIEYEVCTKDGYTFVRTNIVDIEYDKLTDAQKHSYEKEAEYTRKINNKKKETQLTNV